MSVEMISQTSNLTAIAFYALVGVIIASAVGAVTISDARRTAFSFVSLAMVLAVVMTFEVSYATGIAALIPGIVVGLLYWRSASGAARLPVADPEMEDGPNRPVALFITLSLVLILTPVWASSMWKGHAVTALEDVSGAIINSMVEQNAALFLALLFLIVSVAVTILATGYGARRTFVSTRDTEQGAQGAADE